jgi:hypothetical protein
MNYEIEIIFYNIRDARSKHSCKINIASAYLKDDASIKWANIKNIPQ